MMVTQSRDKTFNSGSTKKFLNRITTPISSPLRRQYQETANSPVTQEEEKITEVKKDFVSTFSFFSNQSGGKGGGFGPELEFIKILK
jgi:hypothetical protein